MTDIADVACTYCKIRGIEPTELNINSYWNEAAHFMNALNSLGWLSPDQLAIRDAETTQRALELAVEVIDAYSEYDSAMCCDGRECGCQGSSVHQTIQHYIRALQPAPTGWKLVPEELPAENNKKAVKLALSATVGNWPDYMNSLYRVMIGSVK